MNGTGLKMRGVWRAGMFLLLCVGIMPTDRAFAELSLLSSFTVSQSYINNLFYKDTNRKGDFGTFLGPNLTLQYENPDIVIGATYFGRLALFINNPNANTYIQNLNIILDLPFLEKQYRGLTVDIDESMNFTPVLDAFSLTGAEDERTLRNRGGVGGGRGALGGGGDAGAGGEAENAPGGIQGGRGGGTQGVFTQRANAFFNYARITLGYAWTPRTQSSLGYTNQYRHFFSSGFQDSIRHGIFSTLSYRVTERTTVSPSYYYQQAKFIGKSTQDTSADKIISHRPGLGIYHTFIPSLRGAIDGGVTFSKQKNAEEFEGGTNEQITNKWEKKFTGLASLTKTYRRGEVSLTLYQNIGFGGGLASQSTRTRTVTGRIGQALTQRMSGFASLGWSKNDSVDGNAFDTNTYRIQTGLGYPVTAWLFGNLLYSHIEQKSNGSAADDLSVDTIFLGLTALADPWVLIR